MEYPANHSFDERELLKQLLLCFVDAPQAQNLAEALLNQRGSLRYLCEMPLSRLREIEDLPPNAAFLLAHLPEILTAARLSAFAGKPLRPAKLACAYFAAQMSLLTREQSVFVPLDARYRPLGVHASSSDCVDSTAISPHTLLSAALRSGARAMLIGHNHPGGSAHFSWADVNTTLEIIDVLAGAGIPLLDHILVANGEGISMRASGAFDDMIWLRQGVRVPPLEQWLS